MSTEAMIIGAGPAGLAVAVCLKHAGIPCVILEQNDAVGSAWHRHYDRLHLHTDKRNSELPFLHYPKDYPRYPSRSQFIAYLESYASKFQLDVHFGQRVRAARYDVSRWEVETQTATYRAPSLVIAAGFNHEAFTPTWPGQDSFTGIISHSSEYKTGEVFRGRNVLVVGFGNSGGEIAIDLWEHGAKPGISVRSAVNVIPRELLGIPILSIGILQSKLPARLVDLINAPILRAATGDITGYGLRKLPYGPMTQIRNDGHIPLIDVGTIKLIKEGHLTVYPGIERFTANEIRFVDGRYANFDAVILATGYRPRVDMFLEEHIPEVDAQGGPSYSGRETSLPGLYFCGYYVSPTGMLREIAIEAKQISASISSKKT
jgi:Predicted flavoprotein involved in K+ transport